jgi:TRAP-type C4-dicarboxylate transport system permease small subunit
VKIINSLSRVLNYVAMGLLLMLMMLTVADVFLRFAFNSPISGASEMAALIMVCLVLGVAWCAVKGGHVSIDMVISRFPPRVQAIVDSITLLIGLAISVIITWQGFLQSLWEIRVKYLAGYTLTWPTFPFWWIYLLGWAVLCLVMVTLVIQKIKVIVKR